MAKGFDTFCPVSRFISKEELPKPQDSVLWLKVDDELRQRGSTSDMIFSCVDCIFNPARGSSSLGRGVRWFAQDSLPGVAHQQHHDAGGRRSHPHRHSIWRGSSASWPEAFRRHRGRLHRHVVPRDREGQLPQSLNSLRMPRIHDHRKQLRPQEYRTFCMFVYCPSVQVLRPMFTQRSSAASS